MGQWTFIGPGSEKKYYFIEKDSPQGIWHHITKKMLIEFAESGCQIFHVAIPLSRSKLRSTGHEKLSIHIAVTQEIIEIVFRKIVTANQLSFYGAVEEMCEEYESHHDTSWRPDVVMRQSILLSEIKTEVLLENDDKHINIFLYNNLKNE